MSDVYGFFVRQRNEVKAATTSLRTQTVRLRFERLLGRKRIISSRKKCNCCLKFLPPANEAWGKVIFTVRNEVAKVMFLHLSVCHSAHRWGGSASVHAGTPPQSRHPPRSRHPPGTSTPQTRNPPGALTPPPQTATVWTVRILLECILVS